MKTTLLATFILAGAGSALGDVTLSDAAAVIVPGGSSTATVENYIPGTPVYFTMTCTMNVQAFKQALTTSASSPGGSRQIRYTLFSAALTGEVSQQNIGAGITFRTAGGGMRVLCFVTLRILLLRAIPRLTPIRFLIGQMVRDGLSLREAGWIVRWTAGGMQREFQ